VFFGTVPRQPVILQRCARVNKRVCLALIRWEIPRLYRGGSKSLTGEGVYGDRYPVCSVFSAKLFPPYKKTSTFGIGIAIAIGSRYRPFSFRCPI